MGSLCVTIAEQDELQRVSEDGCLVHRLNSGVSVHCRSSRYGVFYRNAIHYQRVSHLGRADRGKVHLRGASQLPPSHDSPAYTVIGGRGVLFNAAEGRAQEMQRRPPSLADIQRGGHPGVNGPTDPTDRHQLHNRHLFGQIAEYWFYYSIYWAVNLVCVSLVAREYNSMGPSKKEKQYKENIKYLMANPNFSL